MTGFPEPLTPPDCDLRGMPYMPVDLVRLFDSDLYALSSGDEFKVAFTLWGKAFLQVPAGSLPDDDRILAHLSGAGRLWTKFRSMALRGWIKCSDGRLYHPVVAAKARDAWEARIAQRSRTEAARAARAANRKPNEPNPAPPVTYPRVVSVTSSVTENVAKDVTGSKGEGELSKEERKNPRPATRSAPKGARLGADWRPADAEREFAARLGLDPDEAAAEFRDFWCGVPGAKGLKLDWAGTFRNSCRMLARRKRPGGGGRAETFSAGMAKRRAAGLLDPDAFADLTRPPVRRLDS